MKDVIRMLEDAEKLSDELFNKLKQITAELAQTAEDDAFFLVCEAVKEWEKMDYFLRSVVECLR